MTISVTSKNSITTDFNFREVVSSVVRTDNVSLTRTTNYTYGTGNFQIDAGIRITGVLGSGGTTIFDLANLSKESFNLDTEVDFSGVKSITISNASTGVGYEFNVRATGVVGASGLFNGSGNLTIHPYSFYNFNDPHGGFRTLNNKEISLVDGGSGVSYTILVLGTLS